MTRGGSGAKGTTTGAKRTTTTGRRLALVIVLLVAAAVVTLVAIAVIPQDGETPGAPDTTARGEHGEHGGSASSDSSTADGSQRDAISTGRAADSTAGRPRAGAEIGRAHV